MEIMLLNLLIATLPSEWKYLLNCQDAVVFKVKEAYGTATMLEDSDGKERPGCFGKQFLHNELYKK